MVNAKRCMCGLCGKMVKCRLIRGRTVDKYVDTVDNLALNIPEASQKELLKQGRISAFCIQTQVFS